MFALLFLVVGLLSVCYHGEAAQDDLLTASPATILEGLSSELTLRCSLNDEHNTVNDVLLIQMEKLDVTGHQVSIATVHSGQAAVLDSSSLAARAAKVSGTIDRQNLSASYLEVTIVKPEKADAGQYVCVIMALDSTNLLTQFADHIVVNISQTTTVSELRHVLTQLMEEVHDLKSQNSGSGFTGNGSCSCSSQDSRIAQLESQVDDLMATTTHQAEQIAQLRRESPSSGHHHTTGSGFMAAGQAGSVHYSAMMYESHNSSYDPLNDKFTAPADGFYLFHAYDAAPTRPMLLLSRNQKGVAVSGKAVPLPGTNTTNPVFSPLSVSSLLYLQMGDVVGVSFVDNTQSYGATFSGAMVTMP